VADKPAAGASTFPADAKARKQFPVATGVVDYFPDALIAIAELSRIGNDQHNPGQPLHWARGKGGNNADEVMRHFIQRGTVDSDGVRHSTKVAWRALAILQLELEAAFVATQPEPEPAPPVIACGAYPLSTILGTAAHTYSCKQCKSTWDEGEPKPCLPRVTICTRCNSIVPAGERHTCG
jgi:Domain of unknown function (DUF5664)